MKMKDYICSTILGVSIITQIVLTYTLWEDYYDILGLVITGYIFWGFSIIFGVLPVITFRMKGDVPERSSYIQTTKLVDKGIYAIVRHPQYLAGILWSIALVFISQHWVVDILCVPVIAATYFDSLKANKRLIEKFGEEYVEYMKRVPSLNALWGILKLLYRCFKNERVFN